MAEPRTLARKSTGSETLPGIQICDISIKPDIKTEQINRMIKDHVEKTHEISNAKGNRSK
jgi:hypothetical protein